MLFRSLLSSDEVFVELDELDGDGEASAELAEPIIVATGLQLATAL